MSVMRILKLTRPLKSPGHSEGGSNDFSVNIASRCLQNGNRLTESHHAHPRVQAAGRKSLT